MTFGEKINKFVAELADERRKSILSDPYQFEEWQTVYVVGYDYKIGDALIKQISVKETEETKQVKYSFQRRPYKHCEKEYIVDYSLRLEKPEMPLIFATVKEAMEMSAKIDQGIEKIMG